MNGIIPQKSLKKNACLNVIRTGMGLIFPLITFPYSSKVLGPSGIGKVNFAQSIIGYFAMAAALGISTYGIREAARVRNDKAALTKLVSELLFINFISTAIAYGLLAVALFLISPLSEYRNLLLICSGKILFATLGVEWLYTALEEFSYITVRSILFQILSLILLFTFVRESNDCLQYAAIGVISSVGANICNFIHARRYVDLKQKTRKEISKHLKPVFTLFAMCIAVSIYTVLDTTMLGFIAGDEQVGYYSAATKINRIVLSVITAATSMLLPRLSYYVANHNTDKFFTATQKAFAILIMISLPAAAGLCVLAKPVILILSDARYLSAVPVMQIINPVIIMIALSGFIGIQIFMPLKKEKITLFSVILGAIINFILNLILIPRCGAFGAGISTLCAETFVTVFQLIYAWKYFNWKV